MRRKGQTSLEQMLMSAIALAFIGVIVFFALNFANDSIRVAQAQDAVDKLAKSADYVDSLGPLSQDKVDIFVPEGLRFIDVSGDRVHMRVSLSSGDVDVYAHTHAELIGDIPSVSGPQEVTISATPDGRIRFGEAALLCLPATITRTFAQGDMGNDSFTVTNVGDFQIVNITTTLSGNLDDSLSIVPCNSLLDVGQTGIVGLNFNVPLDKDQGIYSGWITVTGSNNTECGTAVTVTLFITRPGGPDEEGPIVTYLQHFPLDPTKTTPITINATGDDSNTGNSTIALCQLEMDYSGIWEDMAPSDGAYDEIVEDVTFNIGTLRRGGHTVRVRCIDSELNIGPVETTSFSINQMLFISLTSALDTPERRWTEWLSNHTSGAGLSWGYDLYSADEVVANLTDIYEYDAVLMADAPSIAPELYALLIEYRNSGGYIIILAEGMKFALEHLNVSTSNSQSNTNDYLRIQESNYITQGYTVGQDYQITTANDPIYYNANHIGGTAVGTLGGGDTQPTIIDVGNVITYGVTKPAAHTADGDIFATRVIDYGVSRGG